MKRSLVLPVIVIMIMPGMLLARDNEKPGEREKPSVWTVEPLRVKGKDEKKWFFELSAGYGLKMGNTDTQDIDGSTSLEFNNGKTEFSVRSNIHYGETSGEITENNFHGNIMYDYYLVKRWEFFFFSSFEYDFVGGITFRNNTGAGIKFVIFKNWFWRMDVSGAPVFQYELQENDRELIDPRLSFRYRVKIRPVEILTFNYVMFYIPNMLDFTDYRYSVDTYLQLRVTEFKSFPDTGLYINIGYKRKFDSDPPAGNEKGDNNFYVSLSVKL
jgi:hypothetical protein